MVIHNIDINSNRFPTFMPTAFLTTAAPTLTLTLTIALTMTVLTFWSEMLRSEMQWAEKEVTILIVYQKTSKTRFLKIFQNLDTMLIIPF